MIIEYYKDGRFLRRAIHTTAMSVASLQAYSDLFGIDCVIVKVF